jgi:hypothetical protein
MQLEPFTIIGYYAVNDERFVGHVLANTAYEAEMAAQERWGTARNELGNCVDLRVCGVLAGHHDTVDDYAPYVDPHER